MSFRPCFLFSKKATWLSRLACRYSFWAVLFIRPPPDNRFRPTGRGLGFCNLIFIVTSVSLTAAICDSAVGMCLSTRNIDTLREFFTEMS